MMEECEQFMPEQEHRNLKLLGILVAALATLISVFLGVLLGYALNFEPDFVVSLSAQKVYMQNPDKNYNTVITIDDKCPAWIPYMHYDNQIYFSTSGKPAGFKVSFDPSAINDLEINNSQEAIIKIETDKSVKPNDYFLLIDINGADTKKKTCRLDINVR